MVVVGKWEVTVTTLCTPRVSNMCPSCFPTNSWPPLSFSFILLLVSLPHKLTLLILHPPGHFCPSLHLVCSHKGCECPGGQSSSLYLPVWLNPISLGFLQHRSPITSQSFLDTFSSAFFIFSLKDVKTVLSCYLLKWLDCFLQLLTSLLKLCPTWWSLPHFFPAFLLERINVLIFRLLLTLCLFPNVFHNTDFCLDTACESIPGQFFFLTGADLDLPHYTVEVTTAQVSSFWDSFFNLDLPNLLPCSFCTSASLTPLQIAYKYSRHATKIDIFILFCALSRGHSWLLTAWE